MKSFGWWILLLIAIAGIFVANWAALLHAPEERVMGAAQKIFYFHVPAAMVTYLAVIVLLAGSIAYLWTRRRIFDRMALASTELSLLFCTLVLLSGPLWAKSAWGVWWTWEARLTTTLVLWLLLIACLMVRRYAPDRETGARLAAVVGIVAALDLPIIHKAVEWWRGLHPVVFGPGKKEPLAPAMKQAYLIGVIGFVLLFAALLVLRTRIAGVEERVEAIEHDKESAE